MRVELADQTFVAAGRELLAAVVADPARWRVWWPDLRLTVSRDRGLKGQQWLVAGAAGGTAEIYLEPWQDGTIVHLFLRLDLPVSSSSGLGRRRLRWKRTVTELKDELEADRRPGTAAMGSAGRA